jgi:hypothetical protein
MIVVVLSVATAANLVIPRLSLIGMVNTVTRGSSHYKTFAFVRTQYSKQINQLNGPVNFQHDEILEDYPLKPTEPVEYK